MGVPLPRARPRAMIAWVLTAASALAAASSPRGGPAEHAGAGRVLAARPSPAAAPALRARGAALSLRGGGSSSSQLATVPFEVRPCPSGGARGVQRPGAAGR